MKEKREKIDEYNKIKRLLQELQAENQEQKV